MVKNVLISIHSSQNVTLCNLLNEVASVEIINVKFITEVIILRQEHEYLENN